MATGNFDFYVLALSWSAGFCELTGGGKSQCEPGSNLGFVVHGLWPQYERGFPSNCGFAPAPSRIALDRAKGVYPDEGLARYEWRKHGSCTGLSPGDYFDSVARARATVTIPENFVKLSSDQNFATMEIERAFLDANPRLRPGMLGVGCQRGVLEEVRICLTKDLREFRACPEVTRRGCRSRESACRRPIDHDQGMNYRHGFHAGNFADVLKHALLARLLTHFMRKNARFRMLDTHAGEGAYDLFGEEAERTGEWRCGVGRLADLSARRRKP